MDAGNAKSTSILDEKRPYKSFKMKEIEGCRQKFSKFQPIFNHEIRGLFKQHARPHNT